MLVKVVQLMVSTLLSSSSSSRVVISSPILHRCNKILVRSRRISLSFLSTSTTRRRNNGGSQGNTCFRSFRLTAAASSDSKSDDGVSSSLSSSPPAFQPLKVYFCQWCGAATKQEIPEGEEKARAICTSCGKITYQNPKMVTGCLVEHDDKVLLCKRKIPPSYGLWTLPAGYMEIGESAVEGASRETWEEANAVVEIVSPFTHLDIPLIGQTYLIFRARLKTPHFSPGPESIECRLFALDEIPFDSLAFSSMLVTLNLYIEDLKAGKPKFHHGTINKRPGTGPSDIHSYTLDDHFCC